MQFPLVGSIFCIVGTRKIFILFSGIPEADRGALLRCRCFLTAGPGRMRDVFCSDRVLLFLFRGFLNGIRVKNAPREMPYIPPRCFSVKQERKMWTWLQKRVQLLLKMLVQGIFFFLFPHFLKTAVRISVLRSSYTGEREFCNG